MDDYRNGIMRHGNRQTEAAPFDQSETGRLQSEQLVAITRCAHRAARGHDSMTISLEQSAELSDVELLRRAVTYSHSYGFGVIEKWQVVGVQFGVDEAVARRLCQRFGVDPDTLVAR